MRLKKYMLAFLLFGCIVTFLAMQSSIVLRALLIIPALLTFQGTISLFLYEYDILRSFTWKMAREKVELQLNPQTEGYGKKYLEEIDKLKRVKCMSIE